MAETTLNVELIAQTKLNKDFAKWVYAHTYEQGGGGGFFADASDTQCVALTAIRTCYSANKPTEIIIKEGKRYFDRKATDGEGGTEADRLIRHIMRSKHTSTIEHISYTFAVEGLSRSALAQLTRHRFFSFSVQSQRYCKFGSDDKSGGFNYVIPPTTLKNHSAHNSFRDFMDSAQNYYDALRKSGVPAEDARFVLPNAAACNLVMSGNLRAILDFYSKRKPGRGAQWEIADLAGKIREKVVEADPWTAKFFDEA